MTGSAGRAGTPGGSGRPTGEETSPPPGSGSAGDLVTPEMISSAAATISGAVVRTPTTPSETLSAICGAQVWVKFENLQFTASFKERGARNRLEALDPRERRLGVVAASAGNHAQGVARHGALLGIPVTITMPADTPGVKVARTEQLGARVVLVDGDLEAATAAALELAEREGLTWISPYDDPLVVAGQGTVALEILEDVPDADTLVVPVGGGGLLAGMAVAVRASGRAVRLYGVQSELYPAVAALFAGRPPPPRPSVPTIAEGIAVKVPGSLTVPIIRRHVDDVVTVTETGIEEAVSLYLEVEKTVAEGAGAAPLAALLEHPGRFRGRRVVLVLSGGNIDLRLLASVIMRSLARTGRLVRIVVDVDDRPGNLGRLAAAVGDAGGDIVELLHHRHYSEVPARMAEIELVVETRDAGHAERLLAALRERGYTTARRLTRS